MSKIIGKAIVTDEHGRTHDECNMYLEDFEPAGTGATMTITFERQIAPSKEHPILALEFFTQAVEHDSRNARKPAEKKKGP